MSLKMTTSFHNTVDSNVRALQAYNPRTGWGSFVAPLYTTYNFNLSYQFYPHYHPYVLQLARTLAETDSVYDLLAMNVEYQANPDGSLQAIPNSTRAVLASVPGGAQLLDANQKPVLPGAPLTILDSNTPLAISVPAAASFINPDGSTSFLGRCGCGFAGAAHYDPQFHHGWSGSHSAGRNGSDPIRFYDVEPARRGNAGDSSG